MYRYIVHDSNASWETFLESIFKFSNPLIWALIKGLILTLAIFSTFSVEMYYYIVLFNNNEKKIFKNFVFNFHINQSGIS